MLIHPLIDQLNRLKLSGMALSLNEQFEQSSYHQLTFEERLGLLVDREAMLRENRRLQTRLKKASFKMKACLEDIDYQTHRKIDRALMAKLERCQWIREHHNVLITGATGTGKSYLASALAHKACLEGYSVRYFRMPRLCHELTIMRSDGRYLTWLKAIEKTDVLVLDDWGIGDLTHEHRRDLLEILEDRHGHQSTIMTSQLPVQLWHDAVGDKTLADAIMDRLVHNAYRLEISGESMRKMKSTLDNKKE